jgi:hypothetical protein
VKEQRSLAQKQALLAKKQGLEADNSHLGNHLILLWDDPNRVPPKAQDHKLKVGTA